MVNLIGMQIHVKSDSKQTGNSKQFFIDQRNSTYHTEQKCQSTVFPSEGGNYSRGDIIQVRILIE